jgi:hypothetical protein
MILDADEEQDLLQETCSNVRSHQKHEQEKQPLVL